MALTANTDDSNRLVGFAHVRQWRCRFTTMLVVGITFLSSIEIPAQTNGTSSTLQSSNRFLFIVETSRAMRPRARGVFDAMKQALDSSLNGAIHQGDLVGVWTFNENVYQGLFPSQQWSQPTQLAFAVRLQSLADPNTYLKKARLDKVFPEMLKVVSENPNVTIIFVSSGEGVMEGTPFSAQINSAWKEWHDEQEGVHMPLLTALRTKNGQSADWLLVPAPRPIDLPAFETDFKVADEKESDPSRTTLESGLAAKKAAPAPLAPEQQVAFSVWALGRTSLVNTDVNHSISSSKVADPAPVADPPSTTTAPIEQSSKTEPLKKELKGDVAVVPTQEQAKTAHVQVSPSASEATQTSHQRPVTAPVLNDPPADAAKPVELVFVTNAPTPPAAVPQPEASPNKPAVTPVSIELAMASAQPKDVVGGESLLAHARAANPQEEKPAQGPVPAPQRNFLRENINPLALMLAATFGAAYCFRMWFLTHARATGNVLSLTRASKPE